MPRATKQQSKINKIFRFFSPKSLKGGMALFALIFAVTGGGYLLYRSFAAGVYYSPGGTYTDWNFPAYTNGYDSLEWSIQPLHDPAASLKKAGLLHYYAYNFSVINANSSVGRGYAGFQTNGYFSGYQLGDVINFSIWGSNGGYSPKGLVNPNNTESGGYQIMLPFTWEKSHIYRFQLKSGTKPPDSGGLWWGLWVKDTLANVTTYIGELRVPKTISGMPSNKWSSSTYAFAEDLHWLEIAQSPPKLYSNCTHFERSAMAFLDVTANNGAVHPYSGISHDNSGQKTTWANGQTFRSCPVTTYTDATFNAQHNIGYWTPPATATITPYSASAFGNLPPLSFDASQDSHTVYDVTNRVGSVVLRGNYSYLSSNVAPGICKAKLGQPSICDQRYKRRSYLQFGVQGIDKKVVKAALRIWPTTLTSGPINVYLGLDNNWNDKTLLWSNQPSYIPIDLAGAMTTKKDINKYIDIPLLPDYLQTNGTYTLVLGEGSSDVFTFLSKETTHPPQLLIWQ